MHDNVKNNVSCGSAQVRGGIGHAINRCDLSEAGAIAVFVAIAAIAAFAAVLGLASPPHRRGPSLGALRAGPRGGRAPACR